MFRLLGLALEGLHQLYPLKASVIHTSTSIFTELHELKIHLFLLYGEHAAMSSVESLETDSIFVMTQ